MENFARAVGLEWQIIDALLFILLMLLLRYYQLFKRFKRIIQKLQQLAGGSSNEVAEDPGSRTPVDCDSVDQTGGQQKPEGRSSIE